MFPESQQTNTPTDYPVNLFVDEPRDYANLWDGQALRAMQTTTVRQESQTVARATSTPSTMTMRG